MIFFLNGRKIRRGDVYWVSVDGSIGGEIQTGRPAVIVSGDKANETISTVIVAFTTTQGNGHPSHVPVIVGGNRSKVKCDQIRTIAKERLSQFIGTLTDEEMRRVSGALAAAMCIPIASKGVDIEEYASMKAEVDMWKRLYERAMDQLVELKVANDFAVKMTQRNPVVAVEVEETEPPVEVAFEEPTEKVDLNSCTVEDLKKCGCTEVIAKTIIAGRPYKFVSDIRRIPGITNVGYRILEHKVCVAEPEVAEPEVVEVTEKEPAVAVKTVNLNAASSREIVDVLGCNKDYASRIVRYRRENGRFVGWEELKDVKFLPKNFYERHKDQIVFGEYEPEPEPKPVVQQPTEVVNINTASAKEINEKLGLSMTICYSIVGHRKRNGSYKSVEDLKCLPRITEYHLNKFGHLFSVGDEVDEPKQEDNWLDEVEVPTPTPESPAKVNVNTANVTELMNVGFSKPVAGRIVATVKKYGPFRSLDELTQVDGMRGKTLRKLRDKLEV